MQTLSDTTFRRRNQLDTYLDGIKHLPPTPTLMIKLINLFRQQDADVDEIVALMRRDPALSVEVLRRCNNSFFGTDRPARDINEAVFCLGFYEVYQITVSLFSMQMMNVEKEAPGFPAEKLRRHSSLAGIAAGILAPRVGAVEGMAFTAGLLHDLGKLAFAVAEGRQYVEMVEECERTGESLSAREKITFGFNHSEIGARLLERWGVPEEIVLPVLGHNDSGGTEESQRYVAITNLASRLAAYIDRKNATGPFAEEPGVKTLTEFLGLENEQIVEWEKAVRDKLKNLPGLMMACSDSSCL